VTIILILVGIVIVIIGTIVLVTLPVRQVEGRGERLHLAEKRAHRHARVGQEKSKRQPRTANEIRNVKIRNADRA